MRKFFLSIVTLILFSMGAMAQDDAPKTHSKSIKNYKRSAIEADFGLLRPSTGDGLSDFAPFNVNLGYRYNFNKTLGLKLTYEYGNFDLTPEMSYHNVSLLVPVNLSSLTNLDHYWRGVNFFAEIGGGVQSQTPDVSGADDDMALVARLNLKMAIKLSKSFALNLSLMNSYLTFNEDYHFSGDHVVAGAASLTDFRANMFNSVNVGLSYYIGGKSKKGKEHIDWAPNETYLMIEDYLADAKGGDDEALSGLRGRVSNNEGSLSDHTGEIADLKKTINDLKSKVNELAAAERPNQTAAPASSGDFSYVGGLTVPFALNSVNPSSDGLSNIVTLANYLKSNSGVNLLIKGHADATGSSSYNQSLSERRAKVVKGLLEELGVAGSRLETKGYGESDSLTKGKGATANTINRRVDFEVK